MLNPDQVAKKLNVSIYTVINYIKTGKIKAIQLDRIYRVKEEDLDEFIKSKELNVK